MNLFFLKNDYFECKTYQSQQKNLDGLAKSDVHGDRKQVIFFMCSVDNVVRLT